ncbi:4-aminobutyrate--2-oxoglutarate transaminase [Methyloprofundus sp.]|uniref:4-aminobutyrate--2-oxoglutarate transaminase n=1 Tax=Methyloprofundus sp. TaxID=2020875 RepID=UPI003D10FC31
MTKNADLLTRRQAAVAPGVASATTVFASKALNAEVWDADGKRYLDFAMGIAVCNTGHCHPKVIAAAKAQCDNFTHTAFQVVPYEPYVALCEKLNAIAPIKDAKSVLFTTGSEAVENAVKLARVHTGRQGLIAFRGAFHGRTALTSTLTGKIVPYRAGGGVGVANVFHAPFPIEHHGISVDDAMAGLATIFKTEIEAHNVAAIIVEPVQGEGGFYQAPNDFMQKLRALCDDHGIMLICDEIQTGFGRTGKLFASEHSGIEPDLITVAKAMGGGFPVSGVIGKATIMDSTKPGGLGGTYGGNPVACAAALATIAAIEDEGLVERSVVLGNRLVERLNEIKARDDVPAIGNVRGVGSMVAFELVKERGGNEPNPDLIGKLTAKAAEKGLILLACGYFANTIRLLVPLTIPDKHLEEGLDIIEAALIEVLKS